MKNSLIIYFIVAIFLLNGCNPSKRAFKQGENKFLNGEYENAIEKYKDALAKGYSSDKTNYKLGECYRLSNRIGMAEPFYQAAIEANTTEENAHFYQIFALKSNGKYTEAKDQLMKYGTNKQFRNPTYKKWARDEKTNLEKLDTILAKKNFYQVTNYEVLNTEGTEYSPVLYNEGEELIFTSSRGGGEIYLGTGQSFTDLYKIKFDDEKKNSGSITMFNESFKLENVNQGTAAISPDGSLLVFTRGNDGTKDGAKDTDLYISRFHRGVWSTPEKLEVSDEVAWDSSPAFSNDGKTLYFASTRDGGQGGVDLWSTRLDKAGRFSNIRNMGKTINTPGNDLFPYVSDDGKLYFASDGHPGLGGLDIFSITPKGGGVIEIENLGAPINSASDDFGINFINETSGFLVSNRPGGKGDDDIYFFEDRNPNLKIVRYHIDGVTVRSDNEEIVPFVKVKVTDNQNKLIVEKTTGPDGKFTFLVDIGKNYIITTEKEGYFTKRDLLTTAGKAKPQSELPNLENDIYYEHEVKMDEIVLEKAIVLENIYYDLNKAEIRDDAALELDKLVTLLQDNPNISIELSSHTDNRGDDNYNLNLSQKRAESAVGYLVNAGIAQERLTAKGYGEIKPVIENATTEEEHQQNRRTEFKVTKI